MRPHILTHRFPKYGKKSKLLFGLRDTSADVDKMPPIYMNRNFLFNTFPLQEI